ncbi:ROK family protein [Salana multivorans]|uniref:ROK family protein n=1 Tax=Salana multivorans TaxID=120377 RepID=UPI001B88382F|nr:ROK family protein [Salana multivorans]
MENVGAPRQSARRVGHQAARQAARQAGLRRHNLALVLDHVARAEPTGVSRASVAEAAGLTRATVSSLVETLLALGLVEWAPATGPSSVGRPASPIRLARGRWAGLGLEVGANQLAVAVVDLTGETLARAEVRGDFAAREPAATLEALAHLAERTWEQARAAAAGPTGRARRAGPADHDDAPHGSPGSPEPVERPGLGALGVALAVPGIVRDGVVLDAPRLGWTDVDAARALHARLARLTGAGPAPGVVVGNEATLAALAEAARRGPETFLYVSAGVGVGGACVVDGQLQGGVHGFAGELGHVTVDPAGPRCRCGATGCLEQYAGATALAQLAPAAVGRAVGIAVAGAVNVLDVGRVVLGGTLGPLLPAIGAAVDDELATRVLAYPWAPAAVEAALVTDLPALRGAALAPVLETLADPERLEA